jgi:ABC-2 type transport system ATP-binding protein
MRFNGLMAVDHVSFTVPEGEVFGFIGPNGAGKTTTIKMLATLLVPTDGRAWVDGHCVVNEPEAVRRVMGYMPDYYGVYDGITVWEYLDFFAAAYRLPYQKRRSTIDAVIELTDLEGLRHRLVGNLSKGMKQRLCVAKTLIHDPKVLLLDEPAAGLDPRARIELRELLKELAHMGKTIFISSHILTELSDICTTVGIIERGRMLAAGSVDDVTQGISAVRRVTMELAGHGEEAVRLLEVQRDVLRTSLDDNVLRFELSAERERIAEIVKLLAEAGIPILGVRDDRRDLEGAFLRVTKGEVA